MFSLEEQTCRLASSIVKGAVFVNIPNSKWPNEFEKFVGDILESCISNVSSNVRLEGVDRWLCWNRSKITCFGGLQSKDANIVLGTGNGIATGFDASWFYSVIGVKQSNVFECFVTVGCRRVRPKMKSPKVIERWASRTVPVEVEIWSVIWVVILGSFRWPFCDHSHKSVQAWEILCRKDEQ